MTVFANGLEVACKAQGNKVIANFPDVCFTPPENPATPPGIPVPYPSFGFDSDTDKGTSTVKIRGKTVTQKNKSYYTKTSGTEAGCAAKKGVISSKNTGKEYAVAWSSNVKADGEPVNRMSDLSTNNHASPVPNAPPHPKVAAADLAPDEDPHCLIGSYDDIQAKCARADPPGQAHHIVPDKCYRTGNRDQAIAGVSPIARNFGTKKYPEPGTARERVPGAPSLGEGMCICISNDAHKKLHKVEQKRLRELGQAGAGKSKGLARRRKIEALKKSGQWGTAKMTDLITAAKKSVETIKPDDDGHPTAECIKKAKAQVDEQNKSIKKSQIGRASHNPPKAEQTKKMGCLISLG